jgi:hypothetical protein
VVKVFPSSAGRALPRRPRLRLESHTPEKPNPAALINPSFLK